MKDINKAAKIYMNTLPIKVAIENGNVKDLISHIKVAYINGVKDTEERLHSKWINVMDRLPINGDIVLVVVEDCGKTYYTTANLIGLVDDMVWHFHGYGKILAWMPIPKY